MAFREPERGAVAFKNHPKYSPIGSKGRGLPVKLSAAAFDFAGKRSTLTTRVA